MKKKILAFALIGTMAFSMVACSSKSGNSSDTQTKKEEPKEPVDLTGTWQSENNDGSYQEAVITEDTIEINWVSDDGDTKSIYWVGTFTAPTEYTEEYKWTSDRDEEKTDFALLASTDDTKEFTYKDEILSYEVSALGTTTTLELERK